MRILPEIKSLNTSMPAKKFFEGGTNKRFPPNFWYVASLFAIIALSLILAATLSLLGIKYVILMLVILIAIPTVFCIVAFPKFGILVILISSYFIMWVIRMGVNFPLGTIMDGIQALLIFGFFLKQKFHPNWDLLKTPIAIIILIWEAYNLLQVANPTAESRMAWLYTVRSVAVVTLMYFIFSYHIKTISFVRVILKTWMVLTFIGALNAFKQQHFGFFAFEEANFNDPLVQSLLFINGEWRKFSIFSDPVSFSYNMAIGTIFCICMVTSPKPLKQKVIYFLLGCFFTTTMLYSATRAAYVLLPAAMVFYVVLNLNRKVLALGIIGGIIFAGIVYVPTSNPTLYRFQSAFKPSEDASFNVRKQNQKFIQPYIQTHPFGGGLGATGAWGVKFAPHSFLAQLPPDSTYLRVAVELGWVGLLLLCTLFFVVIRQGIKNYFRIRDPELKSYCLAMTLIIFALNVGSYPQESLVQFPINIYFYFFISMINITLNLDKAKQETGVASLQ
ncbi:O-antigen ligase family protein [Paradesertivirga mongoliensis]|uniref:O-antigen ligase family protein n=1 Tax=Paradesertivirga mongoliensis TaxID=2100740 RepID=A0ABW4ZMW7_9SPHI|nr:O-antigen ligase family protein [Pedobacter mongoliensis]